MLVNFSGINNRNIYCNYPANKINFCGIPKHTSDRFESNNRLTDIEIFHPYTLTTIKTKQRMDLSRCGKYTINNPNNDQRPLIIDYDPSRTGTLRDKKNNSTIEVNILKSSCPKYENQTTYHFMSKDLKKEYGYVTLCTPMLGKGVNYDDLLVDYPEYGIVGQRAIVAYLQNWDDKEIGGIGKLADRMGVEYCIENGYEPCLISIADVGSHVAHFKRGKRFIPPEEDGRNYNFLKNKYGKTDPNEILQELVQDATWNGTTVDLTGWGHLLMYLPKDLIDTYRPQ